MTDGMPPGGRLLMVGCGNMGGAMLSRWLDNGVAPDAVTVVSPSGRALPAGVRVVRSIAAAGAGHATVLLALKPQQLGELSAAELAATGARRIVSILGGVPLAAVARLLPDGVAVRAMPALPVAIGQGVVALFSERDDAALRADMTALMAPLGLVEWLDEQARFSAFTALAGCGPGFVFRFIDALAKAGTELGLNAESADRLARATVAGAGAMAARSDQPADALADQVASPGGSTRAGLNVLDDHEALNRLLRRTLAASAARDAEMAAGR